jgi:hypothetical protein
VFGVSRRRSSLGLSGYPLTEEEPGTGEPGTGGPPCRALRRIISIEEDPLPQLLDGGCERPLSKCPEEEEEEVSDQRTEGQAQGTPNLGLSPTSPRGQPVGKEALYKVRVKPSLIHSQQSCDLSPAFKPRTPKLYPGSQLSRLGAHYMVSSKCCLTPLS